MKKKLQSGDFLKSHGLNIQLFADGDWTPPTQEQWEATTRDLHFHKSELGDVKKKYETLNTDYEKIKSGQGEDYNTLKASHEELTGKYKDLGSAQKRTILKYEGKALGLTEEDIKEIQLDDEDDETKIIEKAKAKKAQIDKRVEDYLKSQGIKSTVLNKGKGGEKETFASKYRGKDGKLEKKKFYDLP